MDSIKIRLHPKQGQAFESEKKITLCCSGIQGGKTTVGVLWFLRNAGQWVGRDHSFIIGAPTYKILNQSTLPTFFKYAEGLGTYHKVDQEFHFHSGPRVYIRTSTDPYSVEGIQNVRAIWLDEAGMCKYTFWVNLEGRAARTSAPIICTTTPYGMNWPHQELIKKQKDGERDDVAYFEWTSVDNPTFPQEEFERQKRILDPRTFRMKYMGIHERMEGLVYELTDQNKTKSFPLPRGTRVFAGVDWGFSQGHEFAIVVRAITLDGFRFTIDEYKAFGHDPQQQTDICKSKFATYGIEMFYCDPARPDMIASLNKAGLHATGFHVGKESYKQLVPSINKHYELLKSGSYQIFTDRCPQLLDEYETYHWPHWDEETAPKSVPVALNDHLMDAERYVTIGTLHMKVKEPDRLITSQAHPLRDFWDPTKKAKKKKANWDSF